MSLFVTSDGSRKRHRDSFVDDDSPVVVDLLSDMGDSDDDDSDDDSDEAGIDNDNDEMSGVCEYEEASEALPARAVYDKSFETLQEDLIKIPRQILEILDASSCRTKRVENCRESANDLTYIHPADREKIALLGVTGSGKSSLINSLLGMPNLAKAMASGQSCTYVGTQYEAAFIGQTKKFAAKVEYFDIEEIEENLGKLIDDYNTWMFEQAEDWDIELRQDFLGLYHTSLNIFTSLFCDKDEFGSKEAAEEFLAKSYKEEAGEALKTMLDWCTVLLEDKEADEMDHIEYIDADSQAELHQQLDPLVSCNAGAGQPKLWPLVKKVRIGIEGPQFLKHVILLDLPGLDDTNRTRVDTSLQMMKQCESIWLVSRIDRVITDIAVDGVLMRYGKSFEMVVICTNIDANLDPGLARHLDSEGQDIGNYFDLSTREKELRKLTKRYAKKIETATAKLEGRNPIRPGRQRKPLTEKARLKLQLQSDDLKEKLKADREELDVVAQSRFELLVTARNSNTIRRLQADKIGHLESGKNLPVFCVSNYHYAALKGARTIEGCRLNPVLTGIPALRDFIFVSAAPRVMTNVENFISHKFTVFMKGISMLANTYSVQQGDELLRAVEAPQQGVDGCVKTYVDDLIDRTDQTICKPLEDAREEIVECAQEVWKLKSKWHWATIKAFVRRGGNHKSSVQSQQSWNEQFLKEAMSIFEDQWTILESDLKDRGEHLQGELLKLITTTEETVFAHPASLMFSKDRLRELFAAVKSGIEQACTKHAAETKKERRNIKLDMMHDTETGYFSRAMTPAYAQAQEQSGKGIKSRMVATVQVHLSLEGQLSPFHVATDHLSTALVRDTTAKNKILIDKIETILKQLYRQFDSLLDENIMDDSEEAVRDKLRTFLSTAEVSFVAIKEDLNSLKRRYKK